MKRDPGDGIDKESQGQRNGDHEKLRRAGK